MVDKELIKTEWDKVEQQYKGERESGLALMATVITLSTGSLFALKDVLQSGHYLIFIIPIIFALIQQTLNYLGGISKARASYLFFSEHLLTDKESKYENLKNRFVEQKQESDKWFGLAEETAIITILVFVLCVAVTVSELTS